MTPKFDPEDVGSMFLLNVDIHLQDYLMSQLGRPQLIDVTK
jgi:hypothetical protein